MKDPNTLAFEVKWLGLMIWHRDRHGSDGACGWTFPHLTERQHRALKDFAWCEARDPYFLRFPGKVFNSSRADAECLYRALIIETARTIGVKITLQYATLEAILKIHRGGCFSGADKFCWLPGYHNNSGIDSQSEREMHFYGITCGVAREILADHRRWWRHPRWHVHHWRPHWRVWTWIKRCYIWRCRYCGRRFGRKEYPTSDYSGATHYHSACAGQRTATTG